MSRLGKIDLHENKSLFYSSDDTQIFDFTDMIGGKNPYIQTEIILTL